MRKTIAFLSFIVTLHTASAQKDFSAAINSTTSKIEPKCIAWRRQLHENPELGNREFKTAKLIADHLRSLGIDVKEGVAHTGVVGILRGAKPGPVIGLRADMDALPVLEKTGLPFASKIKGTYNGQEVPVMHACGHDTHVAMLMSVAEILAGMKNELAGTVKFVFQPAEEGVQKGEEGGAELMVKEGVMDDPKVDVMFGLHIKSGIEVGKISVRPGGFYAGVSDMKIVVKGKPSHGAYPWNSVDPIVTSAQIINALQTIVSRNVNLTENAGVITVGAINGGNRSNIIPEDVTMLGTIRSLSKEQEAYQIERIKTVVTKTAEAAGASATIEAPYSSHYPVTFNNEALTAKMIPSLQKAVGVQNVVSRPVEMGAEDFSFFGEKVPAVFFNLGAMPKGQDPKKAPPHHTPEFFVDESAMQNGIKAFLFLVTDYMNMNNGKASTKQTLKATK
ncbi:amidohydrolase [Flavisolibacter ginsenosidimutans]|uniref:amidohydrolase n=1 Tax=Flavisolibacter ginsenosidimutans TaxID=661481 RepID=UPI001D13FF83|nr:amidohydrolase [Flavisolibacter ginsenosidimutans]